MSKPTVQDCLQCAHYFITYDASFPYGCRAMGFKSKQLPSKEVFDASNTQCMAFIKKLGGKHATL
jgi:hypothetical protein